MTEARRTLEVAVPTPDEATAQRVARALSVETHDVPARTTVVVTAHGPEVRIRIESEATRSLRAAANSFLRWADVALGVERAAGPPK